MFIEIPYFFLISGFPTVKKKKKKSLFQDNASTSPQTDPPPTNACDRVPKEGEEYTKFVQRTEKSELPAVAKSASSEKPKRETPVPEECSSSSKWETMSECESLPQEERIDFDEDVKPERMTLRQRDLSPATSERSKTKGDDPDNDAELSLDASIERLRSRLEDQRKRKRRGEEKAETMTGYPKRRLRDVSPASSIEHLTERRLKDERASASGDEKRGRKAPRWRKKYLIAGLFSDYYKEHE